MTRGLRSTRTARTASRGKCTHTPRRLSFSSWLPNVAETPRALARIAAVMDPGWGGRGCGLGAPERMFYTTCGGAALGQRWCPDRPFSVPFGGRRGLRKRAALALPGDMLPAVRGQITAWFAGRVRWWGIPISSRSVSRWVPQSWQVSPQATCEGSRGLSLLADVEKHEQPALLVAAQVLPRCAAGREAVPCGPGLARQLRVRGLNGLCLPAS